MKYNLKKTQKEVIIALISLVILVVSIFNYFNISFKLTDSHTQIDKKYIYLALFAQIVNSELFIVFLWSYYNKLNKKIVFSLLFILIVSFIVPVIKEDKNVVISDSNNTGFFAGGFTEFEIYEYYYNIYLGPLKRVPTGKIECMG